MGLVAPVNTGVIDPTKKKPQTDPTAGEPAPAPLAAGSDKSGGGTPAPYAPPPPLAAGSDKSGSVMPAPPGAMTNAQPAAAPDPSPGGMQAQLGAMNNNTQPGAVAADTSPGAMQTQLGAAQPGAAAAGSDKGGSVTQAQLGGAMNNNAQPPGDTQSVYKDALLKQIAQAGTPADLNDPGLKAQSDAFAVGQSRSLDQARSAMAERASQDGTAGVNSGAFDNNLTGMYERQGENVAGNNAALVGDANKQKLGQMQSALQMMGNDINSEAGRQLQDKIASMQAQIQRDSLAQSGSQFDRSLAQSGSQYDRSLAQSGSQFGQSLEEQKRASMQDAELKRLGIDSSNSLGSRDLALRDKLGTGGLNAQIAQMLMQNQQYGQGLSAHSAEFSAGLNHDALLRLLGGL